MPFRKTSLWGKIKPPAGARVNWGDPVSNGLVGRWLLNTNINSNLADSARSNKGDVFAGATYSQSGFGGNSIAFDGVAGLVTIRHNFATIPLIKTLPATLIAWVYMTDLASGVRAISVADATSTNAEYWLYITATTGLFTALNGDNLGSNAAQSSFAASVGVWYQMAGVWASDSDRKIYVNGRLVGSNTSTRATNNALLTNTTFGASVRSSSSFASGRVDNLSIYSRALSANEILRLYNEPFADIVAPRRRISGPVAMTSNIKTMDTLARASIKMMHGVAIASVKAWNGIA